MRLLQMNLLIFFLLAWTNFMKLKWWWGSWSYFFLNCCKVFIFMFNGILDCSKILKYDLYAMNIEFSESISRYSFIVQTSISRCPLVHIHSRICFSMIFNSLKVLFFLLMWCFLMFFRVIWEWISILFMYYFFYFTYFRSRWFMGLLFFLLQAS